MHLYGQPPGSLPVGKYSTKGGSYAKPLLPLFQLFEFCTLEWISVHKPWELTKVAEEPFVSNEPADTVRFEGFSQPSDEFPEKLLRG